MKKELRRSMKEDELVSGFGHAAAWAVRNRSLVQNTLIAAALILAGSWSWSAWQARQNREAESAFASALEIYLAPVRSELPAGQAPPAGATVFESAAEKYKKATAGFDGVERRFGGGPVAQRARYFSALSRAAMGETAEAQKLLEQVASGKGGLEPALAQMALAELLRKTGQNEKAAEALRKLAGDPNWPLPKDAALMALAQTLEDARKPEEARSAYQRVADEFPSSVYAPEARRRAEGLRASS